MNTSFRTGAELKPRFDELLKRAKVVAADIKSAQQEKKQ
jgi:hypothetical protein